MVRVTKSIMRATPKPKAAYATNKLAVWPLSAAPLLSTFAEESGSRLRENIRYSSKVLDSDHLLDCPFRVFEGLTTHKQQLHRLVGESDKMPGTLKQCHNWNVHESTCDSSGPLAVFISERLRCLNSVQGMRAAAKRRYFARWRWPVEWKTRWDRNVNDSGYQYSSLAIPAMICDAGTGNLDQLATKRWVVSRLKFCSTLSRTTVQKLKTSKWSLFSDSSYIIRGAYE